MAPAAGADRCRFGAIQLAMPSQSSYGSGPERSDDVIWAPDWATSRFDVEKP
jgi:hypothetical protein